MILIIFHPRVMPFVMMRKNIEPRMLWLSWSFLCLLFFFRRCRLSLTSITVDAIFWCRAMLIAAATVVRFKLHGCIQTCLMSWKTTHCQAGTYRQLRWRWWSILLSVDDVDMNMDIVLFMVMSTPLVIVALLCCSLRCSLRCSILVAVSVAGMAACNADDLFTTGIWRVCSWWNLNTSKNG